MPGSEKGDESMAMLLYNHSDKDDSLNARPQTDPCNGKCLTNRNDFTSMIQVVSALFKRGIYGQPHVRVRGPKYRYFERRKFVILWSCKQYKHGNTARPTHTHTHTYTYTQTHSFLFDFRRPDFIFKTSVCLSF